MGTVPGAKKSFTHKHMARTKRPRKTADQLNEAGKVRRRDTWVKENERLQAEKPFWETIWDFCCCSETFWRQRYVDSLIGTSLCDTRESPRYDKLTSEGKPLTVKSDLPDGAIMLREDQPELLPIDKDRLQYRVNSEGKIIDAFYG